MSAGVFVVSQQGAAWEIRVVKPGAVARLAAWWRARRSRAALEELDPRTLRDIGLAVLAKRIEERDRSLQLSLGLTYAPAHRYRRLFG